MNAVGIDVSKGISMVAIVKPFGEIVKMPFDVPHTVDKLSELVTLIKSLDGESRIVMENTGAITSLSLMPFARRGFLSAS